MTKVRVKNVKAVKVKIEPEAKVYTKVPLYLRPHKLHEHEDASDLAVSTEGQLIRKSGNNWVAFTPEYYEDKNRTPGAVLFAGADGKISEDNVNLFWDNVNKRLAINNNNPKASIDISGTNARIWIEQNSASAAIVGFRNFGTRIAPIPPVFGSGLLEIAAGGWNGTDFIVNRRASIRYIAAENWTSTANGTETFFYVTPNGSSSVIVPVAIKQNGSLVVSNLAGNVTPQARFQVNGFGTTSLTWTAQFHNSTGTSNTLMIRDNGWIDIGTSSGENPLTVNSAVNGEGLMVTRTGIATIAGDYAKIGFRIASNAINSSTAEIRAILTNFPDSTATDLVFYTRSRNAVGSLREKLTINSVGKTTFTIPVDTQGYVATINNDWGWRFLGELNASPSFTTLNGVLINPTLVASANNQILQSVLINPTFTNGGFGSVVNRGINIQGTLTESSGNNSFTAALISSIVNQTGTANGITRGIFISPTLTSAFDYRAIEVTIGRSMFRNIEVQSGDTISFGSPNTDGTWRFIRNGNDLIIQRRESGVYNTKQTIAA